MLAELALAVTVILADGQTRRCEQAVFEVGLVTCLNQCGQERCDGSLFCNTEDLIPSSSVQRVDLDQ